jgi:hypothetical protein
LRGHPNTEGIESSANEAELLSGTLACGDRVRKTRDEFLRR